LRGAGVLVSRKRCSVGIVAARATIRSTMINHIDDYALKFERVLEEDRVRATVFHREPTVEFWTIADIIEAEDIITLEQAIRCRNEAGEYHSAVSNLGAWYDWNTLVQPDCITVFEAAEASME